jgi:hypothetical protein
LLGVTLVRIALKEQPRLAAIRQDVGMAGSGGVLLVGFAIAKQRLIRNAFPFQVVHARGHAICFGSLL